MWLNAKKKSIFNESGIEDQVMLHLPWTFTQGCTYFNRINSCYNM